MAEDKRRWAAIKCPHCGWEYHPADIFMPGELIGKPDSVVRDALGKILYLDYVEGEEPNLAEHYVCDECGKAFVVEPIVSFRARKEDEALDFSSETSSLLD